MMFDILNNALSTVFGGGLLGAVKLFLDYRMVEKTQKESNQHEINIAKMRSDIKIKEREAVLLIEQEKTQQSNNTVIIEKEETAQEEQKAFGIKAQLEIEEEKTKQSWFQNIKNASVSTVKYTGGIFLNILQNITAITRQVITCILLIYVLVSLSYLYIHYEQYIDKEIIFETIRLYTTIVAEAFIASISFLMVDRGGGKLIDKLYGNTIENQKKK